MAVTANIRLRTIFHNTHEAIVEEAVFERVQELRANKRRPTKAERQGMFSGLVFCADCGSKLHFATCKSFDGSQDNYRCARYKSNTGDCTAHFIREEVLRKIVLNRIFAVTAMFYEDITAFMELIQKQRFDEAEKDMKRKRREVEQARKRIAELADNGSEAVKVAFILFVGIDFLLFCIYLFRQFFLLSFILCGQLQKSLMADCAVDVVLINPLENPVKFCNPFSCLPDLTPLALYVLFCFIKPLLLYQFHKSSDVLIEHGSYGKYPVENNFPQHP